jgi:putrescine transport system substrate-binding protein
VLLSACGAQIRRPGRAARQPGARPKVLNLYIWSDYLAPDTLSNFEQQTGIKVNVAILRFQRDSWRPSCSPAQSGYDVVVPSASFFERQIKAGVYLPLDKSKLPNLKNMDPR